MRKKSPCAYAARTTITILYYSFCSVQWKSFKSVEFWTIQYCFFFIIILCVHWEHTHSDTHRRSKCSSKHISIWHPFTNALKIFSYGPTIGYYVRDAAVAALLLLYSHNKFYNVSLLLAVKFNFQFLAILLTISLHYFSSIYWFGRWWSPLGNITILTYIKIWNCLIHTDTHKSIRYFW